MLGFTPDSDTETTSHVISVFAASNGYPVMLYEGVSELWYSQDSVSFRNGKSEFDRVKISRPANVIIFDRETRRNSRYDYDRSEGPRYSAKAYALDGTIIGEVFQAIGIGVDTDGCDRFFLAAPVGFHTTLDIYNATVISQESNR